MRYFIIAGTAIISIFLVAGLFEKRLYLDRMPVKKGYRPGRPVFWHLAHIALFVWLIFIGVWYLLAWIASQEL